MKMLQKKKFNVGKLFFLLVFLAGAILAYAFSNKIWGEESIFAKAISTNDFLNTLWGKIPALIKSAQIIVFSILIFLVINLITRSVHRKKSKREETVSRLMMSFLKYLIAIIDILMVLGAWGVNTSALMASAGIIALAVSLGAQSLISDVIAGMFIVFEDEFEVGDIIVVDGWRGTVQEIGIRSTKVIDAGGNIKIFNNSQISEVVNQTKEISLAKCICSFSYGEDVNRVELILKDNLPKIKNKIPAIVDGPYYKGITELADSSVDALIIAKCREEDVYQVQRDLNRELYILFVQNGVGIPYPQVVVNPPDKPSRQALQWEKKTKAPKTAKKKEADKFVAKQKEASKSLEPEAENK